MKSRTSTQNLLVIHVVMPARVGISVGAVRCQSGWVASHVRGMWVALRGSGLQIAALAMRHNGQAYNVVVAT